MTRGKKQELEVLDAFLHTGETCSGTNRCTNWEKPLLYWMWGRCTLLKVWVLSIFLWLNSGYNEWGADKAVLGASVAASPAPCSHEVPGQEGSRVGWLGIGHLWDQHGGFSQGELLLGLLVGSQDPPQRPFHFGFWCSCCSGGCSWLSALPFIEHIRAAAPKKLVLGCCGISTELWSIWNWFNMQVPVFLLA